MLTEKEGDGVHILPPFFFRKTGMLSSGNQRGTSISSGTFAYDLLENISKYSNKCNFLLKFMEKCGII